MNSINVLYLSYDGMCDPLGGSQVLPYVIGLAKRGHRITLISFEKPARSTEQHASVARACAQAGIDWHPFHYHKRPPILSAIYDLRRMRRLAIRLHKSRVYSLVHCRSYLPALVGLEMKRRFGTKFLFDMRGFWADERVDGGIWKLSSPLFRTVYRYFKARETEFLEEADEIVSLTEEGKKILLGRRKEETAGPPITLIPCCVDFGAFPPINAADRLSSRLSLGIPVQARVAVYLGSWGSWYLAEEMMDFFRSQLTRNPDSVFLVVTRDPPDGVLNIAKARGVPPEHVVVRSAAHSDIPRLLAAADYGLFFIKPVFSKKASSPTKMGEFLALELPMVTNSGVGDVEQIMNETGAGALVKQFDEDSYQEALHTLEEFSPDMDQWRRASRRWFDLEAGTAVYDDIYRRCAGERLAS